MVEDELRRPRANLWQIDLVLVGFALQNNLALTVLTIQRALYLDRLVYPLGPGARRVLAVPISGFASRAFRGVARRPFREGSSLALAPPPQLLDELLQVGDPALQRRDLLLLFRHSAAKLSILFKEILVSRHV